MLRAPGTLSVPEPLHHSTPSRKRGPLGTVPSHTGCHPFLNSVCKGECWWHPLREVKVP